MGGVDLNPGLQGLACDADLGNHGIHPKAMYLGAQDPIRPIRLTLRHWWHDWDLSCSFFAG